MIAVTTAAKVMERLLRLTGAARSFEFIAFLPVDEARLIGGGPPERETEARHGSVGGVIHAGVILIARLVVMMSGVVGILCQAPGLVVTLELHSFVDGKRRNANAREAEMIGAVVMSGFGARVGTIPEAEILRRCQHRGIKRGSLGSGNLDFFGRAKRHDVVVIEVER